jgi:hypothetical protein
MLSKSKMNAGIRSPKFEPIFGNRNELSESEMMIEDIHEPIHNNSIDEGEINLMEDVEASVRIDEEQSSILDQDDQGELSKMIQKEWKERSNDSSSLGECGPSPPCSSSSLTTLKRRAELRTIVSASIYRLNIYLSEVAVDKTHTKNRRGRKKGQRYVVAITDFIATRPNILMLKRNDVVMVTGYVGAHWCEGTNVLTKENGIFPTLYVRPATALEVNKSWTATGEDSMRVD